MMNLDELVTELQGTYKDARDSGEITARIILFGIKFADDLDRVGTNEVESAVAALTKRKAWASELNVGKQLAKYVELKK